MSIKIDRTSRPQAEEVLVVVMQKLKQSTNDGYASIRNYDNGREHGYFIQYWESGIKTVRAVSFSEYRNSDNIVVYSGVDVDFAYNTHIPNEEVYRNAKFFAGGDFREAGEFIYNYLLDVKSE